MEERDGDGKEKRKREGDEVEGVEGMIEKSIKTSAQKGSSKSKAEN